MIVWKIIVGVGVIVGIAVGIKSLYFGEHYEKVSFEQPSFSEEVSKFEVTLGGITTGYDVSVLKNEAKEPFYLYGYKPIKIYFEMGVLYADLNVYGGSGLPPIKIVRNRVSGKPSKWDLNFNKNAVEIVDDKFRPIYQFYYKTPSHIVINGIFPIPNGLLLAYEDHTTLNPILPATFKLDPIFKYPSWKYHGVLNDDR